VELQPLGKSGVYKILVSGKMDSDSLKQDDQLTWLIEWEKQEIKFTGQASFGEK